MFDLGRMERERTCRILGDHDRGSATIQEMSPGRPQASRSLVVSPLLLPLKDRVSGWFGTRVITPNLAAARSMGVASRTLEDSGRRLLERHGVHVAPALIARRTLARVVAERAGVSDATGFAVSAESTLRELMRAGGELSQLLEDESPRVRRLAAVALGYREALASESWIDPADVLGRAAELCRSRAEERTRVAVVGYPRLPDAERRFIDAYAAEGSVVFLPCGDAPLFSENRSGVEDFERWGWHVERREPQPGNVGERLALRLARESAPATTGGPVGHAPLPGAHGEASAERPAAVARAYSDLDAEVRGVLGDVKRLLLDGVPADRVAVVARHEQAYGPSLVAVADEYGVPFRVLYRVPVAETRFGSWLRIGLEVVAEGFPFEETARWLADPLAGALDEAPWPLARRVHPAGEARWRELGVTLPRLPWPDEAARSEFADRLSGIFDAFDVARRSARWPREASAFQALAEQLRTLPDADREVSFERFRAEVGEILSILTVPASPGHGGVELHTPLSLFGARLDHVFVLGAAEGQLPDPVRPDPLLDPFERTRLSRVNPAIETVRAAARREEISFWALLQCAETRITLTWPKLLGRSETLPSPYLDRLGIEPHDTRAATIASKRELRRVYLPEDREGVDDPLLVQARHARRIELDRESEKPPDRYDGVTGIAYAEPSRGIGVSRLIDMASCPFKFWSKSVLRLAEPAEAPTELDYALRGLLYHEALHRVLAKAAGSEDLREAALGHLESAFAEAEAELEETREVRLSAFPNWGRDREEHLLVLRNAIRGEDFLRPGTQILALETSFLGAWRGIRVRGRIDRVDAVPEGVALIDYKSGASVSNKAKDSTGKSTVDLQLPVYRAGAAELLRDISSADRTPVADAFYYSVTKAREIRVAGAPEEELERIALEVTEAWQAGAFPVEPDVDWSTCTYCDFDALCRKGPRLERKRRRG